jgi:hypothetical protein
MTAFQTRSLFATLAIGGLIHTDKHSGLVKPFLERAGYKFPVLAAKNFAEDLMPYFSIPRTWIIHDGVIVEECPKCGHPNRIDETPPVESISRCFAA